MDKIFIQPKKIPFFTSSMNVIHRCEPWMLYMDVNHGCYSWMLSMDVIHRCYLWMLFMDKKTTVMDFTSSMNVIHGCYP